MHHQHRCNSKSVAWRKKSTKPPCIEFHPCQKRFTSTSKSTKKSTTNCHRPCKIPAPKNDFTPPPVLCASTSTHFAPTQPQKCISSTATSPRVLGEGWLRERERERCPNGKKKIDKKFLFLFISVNSNLRFVNEKRKMLWFAQWFENKFFICVFKNKQPNKMSKCGTNHF